MERDEVYVPKTRSDLGIPPEDSGVIDYEDYFGDTPIFTLFMLIRQQLLAFPAYLRESVSVMVQFAVSIELTCVRDQCSMYLDRKIIHLGPTILIVGRPFPRRFMFQTLMSLLKHNPFYFRKSSVKP